MNTQRLTFNAERPMTETSQSNSPRIARMIADSSNLSASISSIRGNGLVAVWSALGASVPLWFKTRP